ncbi:bifunctional methylthioribulose-1-phosphate dehydratase/enolase-phosphatase [Salix suchowensis]|nr:bifunctional methylthioribulose-1-phosphate dehydratase/enolase-phosphatase [Salix suchowensis]
MAATPPALAVYGGLPAAKVASQAYLEAIKDTRVLIADICKQFYSHGWVSGTGGSITIKAHDDTIPKRQQFILMSPSGVQKERMEPDDMYVLATNGSTLSSPSPKPYPHKPPKCSDCAPLFLTAECYHYLFDAAIKPHQMGLDWSTPNHGPIQKFKGVLGCNGNVKMVVKAGMDNSDNGTGPLPRCIVLDIEGTTTPITFVADVLFPYARDNVGRHFSATYKTAETQNDIKLLRTQVEDDLKQGVDGAVPIPTDDAGKEEVIAALVANVEAMIKADRKITALKQLQGHIWRTGFENNELEGVVYDDVPEALEKWHALGIKVYIYSSGSRLAQRLIFGKTNYGDLRKYLSGFFDTTVGNKKETYSYIEIAESLGVDKPSDILFLTDVFQEAVAAKAAGNKLPLAFYFIKCCKTGSKILQVHHFTTSFELLNQLNGFLFIFSQSLF